MGFKRELRLGTLCHEKAAFRWALATSRQRSYARKSGLFLFQSASFFILGEKSGLSSLGVYSGKLSIPVEPFAAGLGDHKIITTLCPGGKERMRVLMELVRNGRLDLVPLLTHTFSLDRITDAYELFGARRDNVIKVAIRP